MKQSVLLALSSIPTVGVLSQWIATRLKFPSILLLLISGFILGPVFNLIDPDALFGDILYPIISLSVALILFEGGLTLRFTDLKHTGKIVRNLITFGALITWLGVSFSAYFFLEFDSRLSLLLGAILSVSGPTVITPLLRQIKLKHSLSSILRWEGITIDPIGATLAVLVFEIIIAQTTSDAIGMGFIVIFSTLLAGFLLGTFGALLIIVVFKKRLIPDYLQEAFTFIMVLSFYAISDMIQSESGLLVVTMMGIVLANQRLVTIRHIISFKENITVLLLSSLFVLLAARVELSLLLSAFTIKTLFFLITIIVIIRPISIALSTMNASLVFKEKLFLASIYPRGIVAAAVASLFSIRLYEAGFQNAEALVTITFITIVVTVTFYGLLGRPLVRLLGLQRQQDGVVFVGGHSWARQFAKVLDTAKIPTLIVDTNIEHILHAKEDGLNTQHGSILSKKVMDDIEMSNYGKVLCLTSSDETNLLASIEYSELLNPFGILRLYPKDRKKDLFVNAQKGFFLFGKGITSAYIDSMITAGATFKPTAITKEYTYADFKKAHPKALALCMINTKGRLKFFFEGHRFSPRPGSTLITLRK